jgi:hypothetical protein
MFKVPWSDCTILCCCYCCVPLAVEYNYGIMRVIQPGNTLVMNSEFNFHVYCQKPCNRICGIVNRMGHKLVRLLENWLNAPLDLPVIKNFDIGFIQNSGPFKLRNSVQMKFLNSCVHQPRCRSSTEAGERLVVGEEFEGNGEFSVSHVIDIKEWAFNAIGKWAISYWKDLSGRKKSWNTFPRLKIRPGISEHIPVETRKKIRLHSWNYLTFGVPLALINKGDPQASSRSLHEIRGASTRRKIKLRVSLDQDLDNQVEYSRTR